MDIALISISATEALRAVDAVVMILAYTKDGYIITSKKSNRMGWDMLQDSTFGVVTIQATAEAICDYLKIKPEGAVLEQVLSFANLNYGENNQAKGRVVTVYKLDNVVSVMDLPVTLRDGLQISAMPLHALKDKRYSADVELYTKIIDELEKDQKEDV